MKLMNGLFELQECYEEIRRYNKILKDGSHIYLLKKLKSHFEDYKLKYKNKTERMDKIKRDLSSISCKISEEKHKLQEKELNISQAEGKDYKFIEELYKVVEGIKANIKKLEDESIILMEEEEILEDEKEKIRIELLNIKNNFYSKKEEINNEISLAQKNVNELKKKVIEIQKHLPEEVRNKFEDLIQKRGTAISVLKGGMCLGCRMKVSTMVIDSICKSEEVIACNNCGRILYYTPNDI